MSFEQVYDDERMLGRQIAAGDEAAFTVIFRRYYHAVYSQALAYLKDEGFALDTTQELFTSLWQKREKLAGVENLKSYLFIVARNRITDDFRKLARSPVHAEFLERVVSAEAGGDTEERLALRAAEAAVWKAAETLPEQQRKVFVLRHLENRSLDEIADELSIARNTVKVHLAKSMQTVRARLAENGISLPLILILAGMAGAVATFHYVEELIKR